MLLVPMPRGHRTNALAVSDVFSVDTYTGTGAALTITNGINLAGNGGLVWTKDRDVSYSHFMCDTARGVLFELRSNQTTEQNSRADSVTSFNSNGYGLGAYATVNSSSERYISWTFRKAEKFFDIVTYTGTGSNRTIAHNLGAVPGAIWVKRTDTSVNWQCYHRSLANTQYMILNLTDWVATGATRWNSTTPTSSVFSLGTDSTVNASGGTYVAYIFGHDTDGVIQCGTYTGNGSATGPTVNLGWQPQYVMIKQTEDYTTGDWWIYDSTRSTSNPRIQKLKANLTAVDDTAGEDVDFNATSFQLKSDASGINASASTYIYMAIKAE